MESLALDSAGGSESVYSVVFPALQPPVSEEFGRKRHSSAPGEESNRHRLPLSATPPPPAAQPASAGDLQEKPPAPRDNSPLRRCLRLASVGEVDLTQKPRVLEISISIS